MSVYYNNQIFLLLAIIIILLECFFINYNNKFIHDYIKSSYPDEHIIFNVNLHPIIYFLPLIVLVYVYYLGSVFRFINMKILITMICMIILLCFVSLLILSIKIILTNKRIVKISSIRFLKKFYTSINLKYADIENLELFEYGYSKEILIDTSLKRYRIGGISNMKNIYSYIMKRFNENEIQEQKIIKTY